MPQLSRFLRYCAVGVGATALHYMVLLVGVELGGADPAMTSAVGAICGAAFAYTLNRRLTFASRATHRDAFPRFMLVAALGAGLNAFVVAVGTRHLGQHYLLAQVAATALVLLAGYAANRSWTFA